MAKRKKSDIRNYHNVIVNDNTNFATKEAFKNIRTGMLYTAKSGSCPVYGVTSTVAAAGKSMIIANLAVSFAQLGKKVILVDCDMRAPTQHKIFKVSNRIGLSEVLAGISEGNEGFVTTTDYDGVHIMTAGRIPPNPAELLSGDSLRILVATLKKEYDFIFLDLPPIGIVTDALVLSDIIDGYVFVVRAELDEKPALVSAVNKMEQAGAKIIGMVLNDVDGGKGGYYKSNYSSYHNYAKESYGSKENYDDDDDNDDIDDNDDVDVYDGI